MVKYIYRKFGKQVDKNNADEPYKGIVPRDLEVGDQFEDNEIPMQVTEKAVSDGGYLIIRTMRVSDI